MSSLLRPRLPLTADDTAFTDGDIASRNAFTLTQRLYITPTLFPATVPDSVAATRRGPAHQKMH